MTYFQSIEIEIFQLMLDLVVGLIEIAHPICWKWEGKVGEGREMGRQWISYLIPLFFSIDRFHCTFLWISFMRCWVCYVHIPISVFIQSIEVDTPHSILQCFRYQLQYLKITLLQLIPTYYEGTNYSLFSWLMGSYKFIGIFET